MIFIAADRLGNRSVLAKADGAQKHFQT